VFYLSVYTAESEQIGGKTTMRDLRDCAQTAHLLFGRIEVEPMRLAPGEVAEKHVYTRDETGEVQCEFRNLKRVY
jgi:hypothetical protein